MKKSARFQQLFLVLFFQLFIEQAYPQQIVFDNFGVSRGLPSNNVHAIDYDESGHLWIGTDKGVVRFNGKEFFKVPGTERLTNHKLFSMRVISTSNAWFGFEDGMVVRYNGKECDTIISQSSGKYANLFMDSRKQLWIATAGSGLFLIANPHEKSIGKLDINHFTEDNDVPYDVYEVGEDLNGKLYFLTKPGLKVFNETKSKLVFYRTPNRLRYTFNCMAVDTSGIYIGTNQGIVVLDPGNEADPVKMIFEEPGFQNINCVERDLQGNFWFGTTESGLIFYEKGNFKKISTRDGLPGDKIKSIFADPEGNIWIGHYEKGLTGYKGSVFTHYNAWPGTKSKDLTGTASIYSLFYDPEYKRLWVGTDKGLFTKDYTTPESDFIAVSTPLGLAIESIINWDDQNLAVGSYGEGLFLMNRETFTISKVFNSERDDGYINAIFKLNKSQILVAHQIGLYLFDVETSAKKAYSELNGVEVTTIHKDKADTYWIGTSGKGLYRIVKNQCVKFPDPYLKNQTILSIQSELGVSKNENIIWIGTENSGLHKIIDGKLYWNSEAAKVPHQRIAFINGLNENAWIGTEAGILKLNTKSGEVLSYDKNSGFTSDEIKPSASCFIGDSILAYGTSNGLYFLNPYENKREIPYPKLNILNAYSEDTIPVANYTQLKYSQNNIRFDIAPVSLSYPYSLTTKYKLLGYDSTWLQLNDDRQIRFQKLSPGNYQLLVRAGIGDKQFTEKSFFFSVLKPFWQTVPFYILVALIVLGLAWVFYRLNLNRALNRQAMKHEITQKMAELEMKSLRSQMNPHFIFNSLQSIQNFLFENNNSLANEYLLKFSKLMRLILENSQHDFVPIKSDLMALELYMQLESLRMPKPMTYSIKIDDNIDAEHIAIPPLLLQPFVENAIWHGLHPKKEEGMINVICLLKENLLTFTIEDNGVGRNHLKDTGTIPGFKKESLGVKITEERIKILSESSQTPAKVDFEDLFDTNHHPSGTRVHITIPFEA